MAGKSRSATACALRTDQVVVAVRTLFRRYGYRRTSVDDIAREAGVSKATLYLHFKGKDEMFRAMTVQFRALVLERCAAAESLDAPLQERLVTLLYARFGTALEWFEDTAHIQELSALYRDELAAAVDSDSSTFQRRVERMLNEAQAAGEITTDRADMTVSLVAMTVIFAAHGAKYAQCNGVEGFHDRLDAIVKLVTGGLRPAA